MQNEINSPVEEDAKIKIKLTPPWRKMLKLKGS